VVQVCNGDADIITTEQFAAETANNDLHRRHVLVPAVGYADGNAASPTAAAGAVSGPAASRPHKLPLSHQPIRMPIQGRNQSTAGDHVALGQSRWQNGVEEWNANKGLIYK